MLPSSPVLTYRLICSIYGHPVLQQAIGVSGVDLDIIAARRPRG